MSFNFPSPTNDETQRLIAAFFGEPKASDGKTILFDALPDPIEGSKLKAIANAACQPVSTELNSIGDIKTMEDGTQWRLTPTGWHKIMI